MADPRNRQSEISEMLLHVFQINKDQFFFMYKQGGPNV